MCGVVCGVCVCVPCVCICSMCVSVRVCVQSGVGPKNKRLGHSLLDGVNPVQKQPADPLQLA